MCACVCERLCVLCAFVSMCVRVCDVCVCVSGGCLCLILCCQVGWEHATPEDVFLDFMG